MNKLSLIFAALRAYQQARGKESSTIRGMITGTLAAGAIVGLWYMGAELTADQIGLVLAAVTGIDALLKIVLPDRLGGKSNEATMPALPPIELQGRADAGDAGIDADAMRAADGLRESVLSDRQPQRGGEGDNESVGHNG